MEETCQHTIGLVWTWLDMLRNVMFFFFFQNSQIWNYNEQIFLKEFNLKFLKSYLHINVLLKNINFTILLYNIR